MLGIIRLTAPWRPDSSLWAMTGLWSTKIKLINVEISCTVKGVGRRAPPMHWRMLQCHPQPELIHICVSHRSVKMYTAFSYQISAIPASVSLQRKHVYLFWGGCPSRRVAWDPDLDHTLPRQVLGSSPFPSSLLLLTTNKKHSNIFHYILRDEATRSTGGSHFAICKCLRR